MSWMTARPSLSDTRSGIPARVAYHPWSRNWFCRSALTVAPSASSRFCSTRKSAVWSSAHRVWSNVSGVRCQLEPSCWALNHDAHSHLLLPDIKRGIHVTQT